MTSTPATSEMDPLDQLGAKAFDGFLVRKDLVRKDLVRKDSRQSPVPTTLVEFLLGRSCASTESSRDRRRAPDRREAAPGAHRAHRRGGTGQGQGAGSG